MPHSLVQLGADADSVPSVTCIPFGLYGDITTPLLVDRLSDSSDNLTFVGTTNGLYVVAPGGKLHHFLYSPFGIKHVALIDDITGDGIREVVVALNDTQVPALRCYDGATWEKVWQFAPMTRIWDKLWVERQMIITNLEVMADRDSQRVVITSGRCVLSVDAKDGTEQWRFTASAAVWKMVTLADLNNDAADEVFAGSDDGRLFWLNARTGKAQWQTKLPEHEGVNYNDNQPPMYNDVGHLVSDIIVLDEEAGKVVVVSSDDWAQMYDLRGKRREWDTLVFEKDPKHGHSPSEYVLMSPTADITGDGLAEILLSKTRPDNQYSGAMTNGERALCDSAGNIVWRQGSSDKGSSAWPGMAFETGVFEGKPVYLDRPDLQEIRLIDVKDGESVLHAVPLDALDGPSVIVKQPGGNGYLSFSSNSDLAAMSATGELLWYYPRITNVKTEGGSFVGDGTEDVLLRGESGVQPYSEPGVRLLRMMDGATGAMAWSYEMPYGGLKRVQVTADLVGSDNIQDIIGYCGDTVFIFSGKNGSLTTFSAGQAIASLEVIRNGASGNAFAVGVANGLMIFDTTGTPLWTTTTTDWIGDESGSFIMLDDVNSDNVSDLAVFSNSRIVVLKSNGHASNYELHQTIPSESGFSVRLPEMVADSDGDGVMEMAYFQEGESVQENEQGHTHTLPPHLLCVQSLENGQCLFKADLQGTALAYDLACGDFNGDGYPDSVLLVDWVDTDQGYTRRLLQILSGKDGSLLWTHAYETGGYSWSGIGSNGLPAMNIGDMNGDGADDLACNFGRDLNESSDYSRQQHLQVFDVAHDTTLKDIAVTPRLHDSSFGDYYDTGSDEAMLQADFDADGHPEVIMRVAEPSIPSYDPDVYIAYSDSGSISPQYLALVDMDSGWRLAGFTGFDPESQSFFESHQPGILGVAGCGGLCFLNLSSDLQVTSPEDGAKTRPIVGVEWQGPTDGDFSQVFVDGVRNDVTNGFVSELFLGRGNHTIVVRSVDDYGRISYSPSDLGSPLTIKVTPSPWKPVLLVISLFGLVAFIVLLFYARLHRMWRARRRAARQQEEHA